MICGCMVNILAYAVEGYMLHPIEHRTPSFTVDQNYVLLLVEDFCKAWLRPRQQRKFAILSIL